MTAPDLFAAAVSTRQRGQLADAERLYRSIIALDPRHAGALHYLGVVAMQLDRNEEACDLIARSLAIHKRNPDAHDHAGLACAALGRFTDAVKRHQRAISLKSDYMPARATVIANPTDTFRVQKPA